MKHIRIPPYDKPMGHVICERTVQTVKWKQRFVAGIWYKVSDEVADLLSSQRQRADDPTSKPAFQICTEQEAADIVWREQNAHLARSEEPGKGSVSVADIPDLQVEEDRQLNAPKPVHELQTRHPLPAERLARDDARPEDKLEYELQDMSPALGGDAYTDNALELPPLEDIPGAPDSDLVADEPKKVDVSGYSFKDLLALCEDRGIDTAGKRSKLALRNALEDAGVA